MVKEKRTFSGTDMPGDRGDDDHLLEDISAGGLRKLSDIRKIKSHSLWNCTYDNEKHGKEFNNFCINDEPKYNPYNY